MLEGTDRTRGQSPMRANERSVSAHVSASLRHRGWVRSGQANIDVARWPGAVVLTDKRGRDCQAKPTPPPQPSAATSPKRWQPNSKAETRCLVALDGYWLGAPVRPTPS